AAGSAVMFRLLGQTVRRAWPFLLAAWALVLALTYRAAPPWEEVARDREFGFLPADSPSRQAAEVFKQAFPEEPLGSPGAPVLRPPRSGPAALNRDLKFIDPFLRPGLLGIAKEEGGLAGETASEQDPFATEPGEEKRSIIAGVRTPNALGTGPLLVSPD